jgi:chromosome segregation ATPase
MQLQTDRWRQTLQQHEDELAASHAAVQNHSTQVSELRARAMKLDSELQVAEASLQERSSQLLIVQQDFEVKRTNYETLNVNYHKEKETNVRLQAKVESLEEKLANATQEVERLKQNLDVKKNGQAENLTHLMNELKQDSDRVKSELQEKNSRLSESLSRAKEELISEKRNQALVEDERRRIQAQLMETTSQLSKAEAALEIANQSRQQLDTKIQQLQKQIESLRESLELEKQRSATSERKVVELTDKLRNAENAILSTSDRLSLESSSLNILSKTKHELEETVHRLELENARLDMALNHERQKSELLQKEYNEARQAQTRAYDDVSVLKASNTQLLCQMNEAAGLRQQATQEADDNRALWENEIKSRSKLGLRIAQLEREKQDITNQLNEEKRRARKAMDLKKMADDRLAIELEKSGQMHREMLTLKSHLRTAKKRLKENSSHEKLLGSMPNIARNNDSDVDLALLHIQHELDDAKVQLHREVSGVGHVSSDVAATFASSNGGVPDHLSFSLPVDMPSRSSQERLAAYKLHLSGNYTDKSELQQLKAELEARAQKELDQKLEEVNAYLAEQMRARERLDRIRDLNEMELRREFEAMRKDLLDEVVRLRRGHHSGETSLLPNKDDINLQTKQQQQSQRQQLHELYESESRLRQMFATRLNRASETASRVQAFVDHQRSSDADLSLVESAKQQLDHSMERHLSKGISFTSRSLAGEEDDGTLNGATTDYMAAMQRNFLLQ